MGSSQSQPVVAEVAIQLPSAILEKAAELISKPGAWTQGAFGLHTPLSSSLVNDQTPRWVDGAKCFCALGAVAQAMGVNPEVAHVWDTPAARFLSNVTKGHLTVVSWNDAEGRTQAEVVAKLREAATLAREAGQ